MTNNDALIGCTGFVGQNLASQHYFQHQYNSKNIDTMRGRHFDTIVCAGASGTKWLVNENPKNDLTAITKLADAIGHVRCKKFILISTVDIFATPVAVDEDSDAFQTAMPYGKNRRLLETVAVKLFSNRLIIRLPGLFGAGLKKNAVFDFIHNNNLGQIHQNGIYQYYFLNHLWDDIRLALAKNISALNIATEPVTIQEISFACRNTGFQNNLSTPPPHYDFYSKHASHWGKSEHYLYLKDQVLRELQVLAKTPHTIDPLPSPVNVLPHALENS